MADFYLTCQMFFFLYIGCVEGRLHGHGPKTEEETFQNSKKLLMSSKLLVHFDPSLKLILACNASNCGIGPVLTHCLPDSSEKPIYRFHISYSYRNQKKVFSTGKGRTSLYI